MITIKHPVSPDITYPLERIAPLRDLLFFDIETTGFSGDTSQLYLIGCVYHDGFGSSGLPIPGRRRPRCWRPFSTF